MDILAMVLSFLGQYPFVHGVLLAVGAARLVIKPVMSALRALAVAIPGQGQEAALDKLEASKLYKSVVFVVDWLSSVKLPGAK